MIEGIDYRFIDPMDNQDLVQVELLEGLYKGTIYKYGKVSFEEKGEDVYLHFDYNVVKSDVKKPKKLEKEEDFKNHIGNILVEIMSANLEQDIVEDENGTVNIEESGT